MYPKEHHVKQVLKQHQIDVLLAQSPENYTYVSGESSHQHTVSRQPGFACALVFAKDVKTILIGMDFETPSFNHKSFDVYSFSTWVGNRTLQEIKQIEQTKPFVTMMDQIVAVIKKHQLTNASIGLELDYLPTTFYLQLKDSFPDANFVNVSPLFIDLRIIKQPDEIAFMKQLITISDGALSYTSRFVKEGMSERELFDIYCIKVMESQLAFPSGWSSFTAGVNAGKLGRSSNAIIQPQDVVKFDGGVNGDTSFYTTDFSRSWLMSDVDPWLVRIKKNLMDAHKMMLEACKPGVTFKDLFVIGFEYTKKEFPFYTRGHLGHGISMGPQTAEPPFISASQEGILKPNMILSLENPMYITGYNGFNIEDMILITETGFELLTPKTPHWLPSESKYQK